MEQFIRRQNIALYRKLLADSSDTDDSRRRIISRLLAVEEAKDIPSQSGQDDAPGATEHQLPLQSRNPKLC